MQLTAGSKLREMKSTWVSLVSKNYEIKRTIVQLENEIFPIKQQHGEANKENIHPTRLLKINSMGRKKGKLDFHRRSGI